MEAIIMKHGTQNEVSWSNGSPHADVVASRLEFFEYRKIAEKEISNREAYTDADKVENSVGFGDRDEIYNKESSRNKIKKNKQKNNK